MVEVLLNHEICKVIKSPSGDNIMFFKRLDKFNKNNNLGIIYCLSDPITNEIKYIGKSLNGSSRPKVHLYKSSLKKDTNFLKRNWIEGLKSKGLSPEILILDYVLCPDKEERNKILYKKEHEYIKKFKDIYKFNIINMEDFGYNPSGRPLQEKTRIKMSLSAKKRGVENLKKYLNSLYPSNKFIGDIEHRFCSKCKLFLTLNKFSSTGKSGHLTRKCSSCKWKIEKSRKCQ